MITKCHMLKVEIKFFIIPGFTCSNKKLKQEVLINHSWMSPLSKGGRGKVLIIFREIGRGGIFLFVNPRNSTIQVIYKNNKF